MQRVLRGARAARAIALVVLCTAVALVVAGTSSAATFGVAVGGSSTQTVGSNLPPGQGDPGSSTVQVSVSSDVGGANPNGTIVADTYKNLGDTATTTFHGDVSQGCLLVQGNQAIAVGKLPVSEQYLGFNQKLVDWTIAVVEDNGKPSAGLDRAATGLLFDTSGTKICNGTTSFASVISAWLDTGGVVDAGDYSFSYSDTLKNNPEKPDVSLTIADSAGLPVTVTDAPDPDGLDVTVGGTTGTVVLDTCGGYEVDVAAGTHAVVNCGSVILRVITGAAEVVLGDGVTIVSVPPGGKAEVSGDETSGFTVQNEGTTGIVVTVNGVAGTISPGQTAPVEAWVFQGFADPVANMPSLNKAKAGAALPLRWRLLDSSAAPVTTLAGASITVTPIDCSTHAPTGPTSVGSTVGAFQNLGAGFYQLNWKTLGSYAGTCRAMHLDVGDGVTHDVLFSFK
jgi:hypothetical protein